MTGIERLRALANGDASHEIGKGWFLTAETFESIADQIDRETLLRPLFEDGTPIQVGDVVLFDGKPFAVHACEVKLACLEQHAFADVLHRAKKLAGVE